MYVLQDMKCISGLGIVVFYVTDVLAVPKCQVSTVLTYVCPVACITRQFVYSAFVVVLRCRGFWVWSVVAVCLNI